MPKTKYGQAVLIVFVGMTLFLEVLGLIKRNPLFGALGALGFSLISIHGSIKMPSDADDLFKVGLIMAGLGVAIAISSWLSLAPPPFP